jgi:hypothetical protein
MTVIANNSEFQGLAKSPHRQISLPAGVSATVQIQTKAADGSISWVDVPDGVLAGPTSVTLLTVPGQVYRCTTVAGGEVWVS